jgi:hypothetical protein
MLTSMAPLVVMASAAKLRRRRRMEGIGRRGLAVAMREE